jgi:hypothetical protein
MDVIGVIDLPRAYVERFGVTTLYAADLDAIAGAGRIMRRIHAARAPRDHRRATR